MLITKIKKFMKIMTCSTAFIVIAVNASATDLTFVSGSAGGAFLPFADGATEVINQSGVANVESIPSAGSIENLNIINESNTHLATVFLGSAQDAINGTGFAEDNRMTRIRALFPMYETSFQVAAPADSGISSITDLDGKLVGVGPADGPAEVYFRALSEALGISPRFANGSSAELADQLVQGDIDALWQGAVVPIPPLVDVNSRIDAVIFGLSSEEVQLMLERFPFMAVANYPAGTYDGQPELTSVAAWNFVLSNATISEELAYEITKAVLSRDDLTEVIGSLAASTRAENAIANQVVPFHPGAKRYYREVGVELP